MFKSICLSSAILIYCLKPVNTNEVCYKKGENCEAITRYLFYDINPPEGFNLRRDVYLRFALLAHKLSRSDDPNLHGFKLVLPPWSHLVHWQFSADPERLPWSRFFDLASMQRFAPVIEMSDYFAKGRSHRIQEVYILQHFEDMFETNNFEDRMSVEECQKPIRTSFFYYENLTSYNFRCLSYHGAATKLVRLFEETNAKSILIDHAEVALHEYFGDKIYWQARRSMRFNADLKEIAANYQEKFLQFEYSETLPSKWEDEKAHRNAKGGPYLSIHLRRKDFLRSRPEEVPSLDSVANQIISLLDKLNLDMVFIATDANSKELTKLRSKIPDKYHVFKFEDEDEDLNDGELAIIDQIICSHARYFIGTQESTFSFRIQEEREILGYPVETTFNSFCTNAEKCPQPTVWKIVY